MQIETLSTKWKRTHSTLATDSSFPSKVVTLTQPSGDGVIDLGVNGGTASNHLMVAPYGTGADNDTFDLRVIAWSRCPGSGVNTVEVWVPTILAQLACTLSAAVGVAGGVLTASNRFCDTMTLTSGNDDVSIDLPTFAADTIGHFVIDVKGAELVEFTFDLGGTSTGAGALVKRL